MSLADDIRNEGIEVVGDPLEVLERLMAAPLAPCTSCAGCCRPVSHFGAAMFVPLDPKDEVPAAMVNDGMMRFAPTGECIALDKNLHCTIYTKRPGPCRRFLRGGYRCRWVTISVHMSTAKFKRLDKLFWDNATTEQKRRAIVDNGIFPESVTNQAEANKLIDYMRDAHDV